MTSTELTGWFEYLRMDDEVKANWTAYAIAKAFNGDRGGSNKQQRAQRHIDDDDDEVIDTTSPEFAEKFKGFTNTSVPPKSAPNRPMSTQSTQILMG